MSVPAELRYTPEHEWVSVEGTSASVGITEYAAQQLGDVVYVSLPTVGSTVAAGEPCGEVESVKSVSDLYSPVDGEARGTVTSGAPSPTLGVPIAMAYLEPGAGADRVLCVGIRGEAVPAQLTDLPFYRRRQ